MSEDIREIDRPFHILGVLDGKENFHSGHLTKIAAEMRLRWVNEEAAKLGIKTRYIIKERIKTRDEIA